jgi:glucokinase
VSGPVVAVDVGGTAIKAARFDAELRGSQLRTAATPPDPAAVVSLLRSLVRDLAGGAVAVGVVVPGAVDADAGIARFAANIGWRDVPLRDLLAADTGLPVAVGHDVGAAGIAECAAGALRGVDDGVLVVLGTGIAAVVRSGGRLVTGAQRLAGELGHAPVYPDGEACPCGQRGCLERYASAAAVTRRYAAAGGTAATAAEVVAGLDVDAAARRVWDEAVRALALGLASATMLLDPAVIVLGGGLAEAGEALRAPIAAALAELVRWRSVPRVELSPLGARAGLTGAAILARDYTGAGTDTSS